MAARTRTRRNGTGKALMPRREFIASVEALKLDWQAYWASPGAGADGWGCPYVDKEAADVLTRGPVPGVIERWYNPVALDAWLDDARASARSLKGDADLELDLQARQAHRDVHSGRPIPEHMTGGCGEGDPGGSSVVPLPTSPWLPGQRAGVTVSDTRAATWADDGEISRHLDAFNRIHDGEGWGRLSPLPDLGPLDPEREPEPPHISGDGDDPIPELDQAPGERS